jgi:hypothetical protein
MRHTLEMRSYEIHAYEMAYAYEMRAYKVHA